MSVNVENLIKLYVHIRDFLAKKDEEHEARIKPYKEKQEIIEGILQQFLETNNLKNVKTEYGTCHINTKYSAPLSDPEAFMNYILESGKYDLLDRRANVTAVREFAEKEGKLPPGCGFNVIQKVGVRRPRSTNSDTE